MAGQAPRPQQSASNPMQNNPVQNNPMQGRPAPSGPAFNPSGQRVQNPSAASAPTRAHEASSVPNPGAGMHVEAHGQYPLNASLNADGTSAGPQQDSTDVPWVVQTRLHPGQQIQRSNIWGILTAVAAGIHLLVAAIGVMQAVVVDIHAFVALLPYWGILTLLVLAGVIMCFVKRGSFNRWMAIISAGTLIVSNPVLPLAVVMMIA